MSLLDKLAGLFKDDKGEYDLSKILAGGTAGLTLLAALDKDSGLGQFFGFGGNQQPVGYQGKIPDLVGIRAAVPQTYDPNRRPGSGGQRYFSDMRYATPEGTADKIAAVEEQATGLQALNAANPARQERTQLECPIGHHWDAAQNRCVPNTEVLPPLHSPERIRGAYNYIMNDPERAGWTNEQKMGQVQGTMDKYGISPTMLSEAIGVPAGDLQQQFRSARGLTAPAPPTPSAPTAGAGISKTLEDLLAAANKPKSYGTGAPPVKKEPSNVESFENPLFERPHQPPGYARGGLASLKQGMYLGGATDGMADELPATINGEQEAALSDGEFVIPADVVSHLGNGNSDAGAQVLYSMMDRVRKARTGTTQQGKRINPGKMLPK